MGMEIIEKHFLDAKERYPKLKHLIQGNNAWKIDGIIDVIDDEGGYWDSYEVSIVMDTDYPNSLPILVETGNKIERHIDWHMIPGGVCCLSTPAKMFYELGGDITLVKWLNEFAHPFLANHVYKVKTGQYANEEFSHGNKGILEGWRKIIPLIDSSQILLYLQQMVGKSKLSLNQLCFCGSGKKYKRCYLLNQKDHLMNIPTKQILNDINAISREIYN